VQCFVLTVLELEPATLTPALTPGTAGVSEKTAPSADVKCPLSDVAAGDAAGI